MDLRFCQCTGQHNLYRKIRYVKEKGKIATSEYQAINSISKRTATNDLTALVLKKIGISAANVWYEIVGQVGQQLGICWADWAINRYLLVWLIISHL